MYTKTLTALLGGLSLALAQTSSEQTPSASEIAAARVTVKPYSPVSNVQGKSFQRFVNIWLENTVRSVLLSSLKPSKVLTTSPGLQRRRQREAPGPARKEGPHPHQLLGRHSSLRAKLLRFPRRRYIRYG